MGNSGEGDPFARGSGMAANDLNGGTVAPYSVPVAAGSLDVRALFVRHYPRFAELLRASTEPGIAVVAIDRRLDCVVGAKVVSAAIGRPSRLIVGRHLCCQLVLPADDGVSLRHLAIVLEPVRDLVRAERAVGYRVLDLRSGLGLRTEEGKVVGGISCDGPAFLTVGQVVLLVLVTGDPTDFPESAQAAWSFIPERVYAHERPRAPRGSVVDARPRPRPAPTPSFDPARTLVHELDGPSGFTGESLLQDGEVPRAELTIASEAGQRCIYVGAEALRQGVVIGRYERCDAASVLTSHSLSRVHLMIVEIDGRVYAIDTASQNGTTVGADGDDITMVELGAEAALHLAGVATVTWRRRQ